MERACEQRRRNIICHPIHNFCEGFPGGSAGKESACNAGDLGSIPELGRSPGEGKGYPLTTSVIKGNSVLLGGEWFRLGMPLKSDQ